MPDRIDGESRYRYYSGTAVEKALTIRLLRDMEFSLDEIKKIMTECADEKQIASYLKEKIRKIDGIIRESRKKQESLHILIRTMGEKKREYSREVREKLIPDIHICGIRFCGKYSDTGQYFSLLFRKLNRYSKGAFSLYYDGEYREEGADIEACVEVKKNPECEKLIEDIIIDTGLKADYRALKGCRALTLIHRGVYGDLHQSYKKIFEALRDRKLAVRLPVRERYIKGPGFILRGNPEHYLTELILPFG